MKAIVGIIAATGLMSVVGCGNKVNFSGHSDGEGSLKTPIIVPNQPPLNINAPWRDFRVTVDAVENLTGHNFFTNIPKNTQELIERKRDKL